MKTCNLSFSGIHALINEAGSLFMLYICNDFIKFLISLFPSSAPAPPTHRFPFWIKKGAKERPWTIQYSICGAWLYYWLQQQLDSRSTHIHGWAAAAAGISLARDDDCHRWGGGCKVACRVVCDPKVYGIAVLPRNRNTIDLLVRHGCPAASHSLTVAWRSDHAAQPAADAVFATLINCQRVVAGRTGTDRRSAPAAGVVRAAWGTRNICLQE